MREQGVETQTSSPHNSRGCQLAPVSFVAF